MAATETTKLIDSRERPTGRERAASRWITVEPVVALTMLSITSMNLVKPLFVKSRIRELHNFTESGNITCGVHDDDDTMDAQIQSEASTWLLYFHLASGVPAMVSTLIFSTMSDRFGRKLCMALPIAGLISQTAVFCATVYLDLPLPTLFAGEILQGLSGGFGLLFAGATSYISDVTSEKQRTMRIVVIEMITLLVGGINDVGEGVLIENFGFLPTVSIALGFNIINLVYVVVPPFLIETVDKRNTERKGFQESVRSMKRVLEFNENRRRWHMLLLDFLIFITLSQMAGAFSTLVLYGSAKPFCWTGSMAGMVVAANLFISSIGMPVGTKLFSLCLGEYWLMQISCLSTLISFLVLGLAQSTAVIFVALGLGCLRGMSAPISRSLLSKIVRPDEMGAAFAIVGCLESLSMFASGTVATSLYSATVSFMPALTYYVFAATTVIPFGIIVTLQIFWPQRKDYVPVVEEAEVCGAQSD